MSALRHDPHQVREVAPDYKAERESNENLLHVIKIHTRVPSKWRFVDLETGHVWRWSVGGHFVADPKITYEKEE